MVAYPAASTKLDDARNKIDEDKIDGSMIDCFDARNWRLKALFMMIESSSEVAP